MLTKNNADYRVSEWKQLVVGVLDRLKSISDQYNTLELELVSLPFYYENGWSETVDIRRNKIEYQKGLLVKIKFNITKEEKEALEYFRDNYLYNEKAWILFTNTVDKICDDDNSYSEHRTLSDLSYYLIYPNESDYSQRIKELGSPVSYFKELCLSLPDDYAKYLSDKEKEQEEKKENVELEKVQTIVKNPISLTLEESSVDAINKASLINSPRSLLKMYENTLVKAKGLSADGKQIEANNWLSVAAYANKRWIEAAKNLFLIVQVGNDKTKYGHARVGVNNSFGIKWYGFSYDDSSTFSVLSGHGSVSEEFISYKNHIEKQFVISSEQYSNIMNFIELKIRKNDNYYNSNYSNCISFVDCVLSSAGIDKKVKDIFTGKELKSVGIGYWFVKFLKNPDTEAVNLTEMACQENITSNEFCNRFKNRMGYNSK